MEEKDDPAVAPGDIDVRLITQLPKGTTVLPEVSFHLDSAIDSAVLALNVHTYFILYVLALNICIYRMLYLLALNFCVV